MLTQKARQNIARQDITDLHDQHGQDARATQLRRLKPKDREAG
jgi:hypothetical protein